MEGFFKPLSVLKSVCETVNGCLCVTASAGAYLYWCVCVCVHYALGALLKHVSVTLIVLYVHALVHYTISEVKEVQILRVDMISASDGPL